MARWRVHSILLIMLGAVVFSMGLLPSTAAQSGKNAESSALSSLPLRSIGPAYPSGRISDFAFFSGDAHDYLVATASGGLWRTSNSGISWTPLFDKEGAYALGVVEIAPSDEKIIWVGTGEKRATVGRVRRWRLQIDRWRNKLAEYGPEGFWPYQPNLDSP